MMSTTASDRFGAMELTPRHDQPLLVPGSAALDAMAAPCVVSVRVVSAIDLRPMHKGITSNPMVEVSLLHDDGSRQFQRSAGWDMGNDLKAPPGLQPRSHRNSTSSLPAGSKVIKSSLNPMWKFDVDFGDVDTDKVVGVLFTVRHVEKFGIVKKDMGQLMLPLRDIMELKMLQVLVVHDIRTEVRKLQSFHQTKPRPGETWFAVSADWIRAWLLFVSKFKGEEVHSPGTVDNMPLISDDLMDGTFQIKSGLVIKKDFRMINKKSWDYYQNVTVQIPADCARPAQWLANLQLDEAGRVNSNYVDSD
ncbi:Peptidase C19, ubiquitin-specific peptidase, DUSP domain [Phytophthora cactorum]|nr:Peptidase C19, ubiquitin-specific peptidase, DUSP domain [Phytophthora cactorum]